MLAMIASEGTRYALAYESNYKQNPGKRGSVEFLRAEAENHRMALRLRNFSGTSRESQSG
jgi:hypothetical protein